jgi:RNA-directed DNA polymerase
MRTNGKSKDYIPVTVPFSAASRAGEPDKKSTYEISSWANRIVWTDRMLNALTVGVRGGKWHALHDKVYSELNLFTSTRKVIGKKGAAGVDRQSTEDFSEHTIAEIKRLREQLQQRT